jgi:hypothetical protein
VSGIIVQRRSLAETIQPVPEAQNRVTSEHAGAGISHGCFHLVAPVALITMNRAMGAGWFPGPKPAAVQPQSGIFQQTPAFRAKAGRCLVVILAITPDHRGHRFPLPHQALAGGYIQGQLELCVSHGLFFRFHAHCFQNRFHTISIPENGRSGFDGGQVFSRFIYQRQDRPTATLENPGLAQFGGARLLASRLAGTLAPPKTPENLTQVN